MITYSLLKLLEDEGFGTIDEDLFFQKLTLDEVGIYISNIGAPSAKGQREVQPFEILSRGDNDIDGYARIEAVRTFLKEAYSKVCSLPSVKPKYQPRTFQGYKNITISKPTTITNVGLDANNRIIYSISSSIIY